MLSLGYEGISLSPFIDRLVAEGVDVLVDIRLNAISRKSGFSKRALENALYAAGIRYVHDPRLGNPKDNRPGYADRGSEGGATARQRFRELLSTPAGIEGLRDLAKLSEAGTVAVFCYEADERHCHREQVLEALKKSSLVGV
jgi:uncharacterized protein (DUF488 family)